MRRQHHAAAGGGGNKLQSLPASHSADSLSAGFQRLSVSRRPGGGGASGTQQRRAAVTTSGGGGGSASATTSSGPAKPGEVTTLADVANLLGAGRAQRVVVMAGAGISTASGIPDFRTPGTGLYDNLAKFKVPYPEAIFDLDYFFVNPKPFFALARELYPSGKYRPNLVHCFCRMLHDRGLLTRLYTQNIDGLERQAGIPADKLVEAHGTFATATCTHCCRQLAAVHVRPLILEGRVPVCSQLRGQGACPGVLKPDIVFFGEDLPAKFWHYLRDFAQCDLLIVLGTSLQVEPFAGIVDSTRLTVPRLLINRDPVGPFRGPKRRRPNDVVATGDLVARVTELAALAGWSDDLTALAERVKLDIDACPDPFEPRAKSGEATTNGNNNNNTATSTVSSESPSVTVVARQPQRVRATTTAAAAATIGGNRSGGRRLLPPLAKSGQGVNRRSAAATNTAKAITTTTNARTAVVPTRIKPGVPLYYQHRRALSQQQRGRRRVQSSSSSDSEDDDSGDDDSSDDEDSSG